MKGGLHQPALAPVQLAVARQEPLPERHGQRLDAAALAHARRPGEDRPGQAGVGDDGHRQQLAAQPPDAVGAAP